MNYPVFHTQMTKEKCSIEKPRFFMDITYKHYHKVKQISKVTIYCKIYNQNIGGLGKKRMNS